jgi:hypothetical protein
VEGGIDSTDENILESPNIALMGTIVVNGSGIGVVILTGARWVTGHITHATAHAPERTGSRRGSGGCKDKLGDDELSTSLVLVKTGTGI